MTKEEFLNGKSSPVNKELMQIFLQCHIVEQTGHGVPKIVKKYGPESYEFWTSMITVTILFAKTGFESNQNATEKSITDEEKIILARKILEGTLLAGGFAARRVLLFYFRLTAPINLYTIRIVRVFIYFLRLRFDGISVLTISPTYIFSMKAFSISVFNSVIVV